MAKEVVLEWKQEQTSKLHELAHQYYELDDQIKQLDTKKKQIKAEIGKLMDTYKQKKIITEGYSVGYIHVGGSRTFDQAKAKAKLIELKVDIDDSFYKISKGYDRLDITKNEVVNTSTSTIENDPHRVIPTLEDLGI